MRKQHGGWKMLRPVMVQQAFLTHPLHHCVDGLEEQGDL